MLKTIGIGLLTVLVLALILAAQAFAWVFATVIHYGIPALVIALLIYAYLRYGLKKKKDEDKI